MLWNDPTHGLASQDSIVISIHVYLANMEIPKNNSKANKQALININFI